MIKTEAQIKHTTKINSQIQFNSIDVTYQMMWIF